MPPRRVDPQAGGGLWLTAVGTGVGAAAAGLLVAILGVAACWLPVSGGHTTSAVRAGGLTFLAALHGGLTVDGQPTRFVPLLLTAGIGYLAVRAGGALANAVTAATVTPSTRQLGVLAGLQAAGFTTAATIAVPLSRLGTSGANAGAVFLAAAVLFALTGSVAFARRTGLLRLPAVPAELRRAAVAATVVYLGSGSLVLAVSLVRHAGRVDALAAQLGGGWNGAPVLVLGLLAAPNAVLASTSYLLGPGFAVGTGTSVAPLHTTAGLLPDFPLLGAVPDGHGAGALGWFAVVATAAGAGAVVARCLPRPVGIRDGVRNLAAVAGLSGLTLTVLTALAGGAIGTGRLSVVGASPWQVGAAAFVVLAVSAGAAQLLAPAVGAVRRRARGGSVLAWRPRRPLTTADTAAGRLRAVPRPDARSDDAAGPDQLAG